MDNKNILVIGKTKALAHLLISTGCIRSGPAPLFMSTDFKYLRTISFVKVIELMLKTDSVGGSKLLTSKGGKEEYSKTDWK
jgi:hypothetical protein